METQEILEKQLSEIVGVTTAPSAASKGIFPEI